MSDNAPVAPVDARHFFSRLMFTADWAGWDGESPMQFTMKWWRRSVPDDWREQLEAPLEAVTQFTVSNHRPVGGGTMHRPFYRLELGEGGVVTGTLGNVSVGEDNGDGPGQGGYYQSPENRLWHAIHDAPLSTNTYMLWDNYWTAMSNRDGEYRDYLVTRLRRRGGRIRDEAARKEFEAACDALLDQLDDEPSAILEAYREGSGGDSVG